MQFRAVTRNGELAWPESGACILKPLRIARISNWTLRGRGLPGRPASRGDVDFPMMGSGATSDIYTIAILKVRGKRSALRLTCSFRRLVLTP